jgi:hypothetical protein
MPEKVLPFDCKLRRVKYLDNIIKRDHRAIRSKEAQARLPSVRTGTDLSVVSRSRVPADGRQTWWGIALQLSAWLKIQEDDPQNDGIDSA